MGTLTDKFTDLAELLQVEFERQRSQSGVGGRLLWERLLQPLMPSEIRCGPGTIIDVKDREVGPFDLIGTSDSWPPVGHGAASTYFADGVSFVLQARDWASSDLTQFSDNIRILKSIERTAARPLFCAAVSYTSLPLKEINDFLNSAAGHPLDGILCIGSHLVIRNANGIYGDPAKVPFVTERGAGPALKAFTFSVLHTALTSVDKTFGWAAYQHL